MEKDRPNILCTKVDEHAGDWPSSAFLGLFRVAKRCVEPKLTSRPEIAEVKISHYVLPFTRPGNSIIFIDYFSFV